jgi:Flp pilus assembly pilin Flp
MLSKLDKISTNYFCTRLLWVFPSGMEPKTGKILYRWLTIQITFIDVKIRSSYDISCYILNNFLRICLMGSLLNHKNPPNGQGLVEYAFLIALVAIVVLAATKLLGPIISNTFTNIANPLNKDASGHTLTPSQPATPTQTPIPSPTPIWETCAVENAYCSFSGQAFVRYGANGTWTSGAYTDGVLCANSVFGDPLPGTVKSCQILLNAAIPTATLTATNTLPPTATATPLPTATATTVASPTPTLTWTTCAAEDAFCSFTGTALVRYGANGTWTSGSYTDGVLCANSVFGDPIYGTVKSCQILK